MCDKLTAFDPLKYFAAGITDVICPGCLNAYTPTTDDFDMDWYFIRSDLA